MFGGGSSQEVDYLGAHCDREGAAARNLDDKKTLLHNALKTGLITLSTTCLLHTLNLIVSMNIGVLLAFLSIFDEATARGERVIVAPILLRLPLYAQLRQGGEIFALEKTFLQRMQLSLLIYTLGVVGIYEVFRLLVVIVDAETKLLPETTWLLFAFAILLDRCQAMLCQIYVTKNQVDFLATYFIHAVSVCVIAYALYPYLDINAIDLSNSLTIAFFKPQYGSAHY